MLKISAVILLSLSFTAEAKLQLLTDVRAFDSNGTKEDYRLGDEWGKKRVTVENLQNESPAFQRAAQATAYLPIGGTGFYLGKFAGKHVIATNHHVCPAAADCVGDKASFKMVNKKFPMTKLYITLPNVDLSLLEIDVPEADEELMMKIGKNFSFNRDLTKGLDLITIGYGVGGNPGGHMMANKDSDCKVFSANRDYKHLADPDEFNPADYKAWSFAHACDISHGDSGSAMVDRNNGDVVGIVWTGKIPKSEIVQSSANLKEMYDTSSGAIWRELSFAVPAVKIAEYLQDATTETRYDSETRAVFKAILK